MYVFASSYSPPPILSLTPIATTNTETLTPPASTMPSRSHIHTQISHGLPTAPHRTAYPSPSHARCDVAHRRPHVLCHARADVQRGGRHAGVLHSLSRIQTGRETDFISLFSARRRSTLLGVKGAAYYDRHSDLGSEFSFAVLLLCSASTWPLAVSAAHSPPISSEGLDAAQWPPRFTFITSCLMPHSSCLTPRASHPMPPRASIL